MGRSDIISSDQRNALYDTDGMPGRLASGIIETDGVGGVIVRNPQNISGAEITGTNIRVFFRAPPRTADDYQAVAIERSAVPHALPEQYAMSPSIASFIIVSAVDFSANARSLMVSVNRV